MNNQIDKSSVIRAIAKRETIVSLASGIIQCAIFADKPEGTNPRVTRQAKRAAESIASEFIGIIGDDLLNQAMDAYRGEYVGSYRDTALWSIGHDVWFTAHGHGVGFWDRDFLKRDRYGEDITTGEQLTEACAKLPHVESVFYRGWLTFS